MNPKNGGKILYYGRAVDPKLLVVLGSITAEKAKVKIQTEYAVNQF